MPCSVLLAVRTCALDLRRAGRRLVMPVFAILIAGNALAPAAANAQDQSKAGEVQEPYQPGLGELMALQQMRHIKLWLAGRAGNWPLADYQIGELREGFDEVNKLLGGDTVEKAVGAPIATLQTAIDGKDRAAFAGAFDKLTAGCNSCHHTLERGFIVIQRPQTSPYGNQSFAPQK
jgi:hypothetical protein